MITVSSELLPYRKHFKRYENGTTSYAHYKADIDKIDTIDDESNNTAIRDDQSSSNSLQTNLRSQPIPLSGWSLKIIVYYDDTLSRHYSGDSTLAKRFIKKIIQQTDPLFSQLYSFPTEIKLDVIDISYVKDSSWDASDETIDAISKTSSLFDVDARIYIFMCMPEVDDGIAGIVPRGKLGYVCDQDRTKRMTIIESKSDETNNEITAAVVLAHEIGHLFGMKHDYIGKETKRFEEIDGKVHFCTEKGGIMDRVDKSRKFDDLNWTPCSRLDLQKFYNSIIRHSNFCIDPLPAEEIQKDTKPEKKVRLPCSHKCKKKRILGISWFKHTPSENYKILTYNRIRSKTTYVQKNADKVDTRNIFIDPEISDNDLIIEKVDLNDAGSYVCQIDTPFPECKETRIVHLHVDGGEN